MLPKPPTLRLIWTVIEDIPSQYLLALSHVALVEMLTQQISSHEQFNPNESSVVSDYLEARIKLIRDTALSRYTIKSYPKPDNQVDSAVVDVA